MVMMINYESFFDELIKIAQEEPKKKLTKERLKRHLKVVGAVAGGLAIGEGLRSAIRYHGRKHSKTLGKVVRHPLGRYAIPALSSLGAYTLARKAAKIRQYTDYGDEGKRPK